MKKNSQIHFHLDTESYEKIKKEAREKGITVSELCRARIKEGDRLERIENMFDKVVKILRK